MNLRVLLVDDHPPVRLGIRSLIQQAHPGAVLAEAGNAEVALTLVREQQFDLVFLDAKLPARAGESDDIEIGKRTLAAIREQNGPPVVIMSAETHNRMLVEEMLRLGAASWVPKTSEMDVALEAIRRALCGGVWLPDEVIGKGGSSPPPSSETLFGPLPKPVSHADLGLTPKEFEVLRLALNGLTPVKIAYTLGTNADNVRKRMSRLYEKFGTANQSSLHAYFAKSGLTLGILKARAPELAAPVDAEAAASSSK
ncbi:MAG TPA: response regulator transcription factor [Povalibacter sp.]|nr:response regulator transcription factor [Povalibacter sp.]